MRPLLASLVALAFLVGGCSASGGGGVSSGGSVAGENLAAVTVGAPSNPPAGTTALRFTAFGHHGQPVFGPLEQTLEAVHPLHGLPRGAALLQVECVGEVGGKGTATAGTQAAATLAVGYHPLDLAASTQSIPEADALDPDDAVESLQISPARLQAAADTLLPLQAVALLQDGWQVDVTAQTTWTSGNLDVAVVAPSAPEVLARQPGTSVLTASALGTTGTGTLTVTSATLTSLQILAPRATCGVGTTVDLQASGFFSDGTRQDLTLQAGWTSISPTVATVVRGQVSGVAPGLAGIAAQIGEVEGTAAVTVTGSPLQSLEVVAPGRLAAGTVGDLSCRAHFADGSSQDVSALVAWSASDAAVVAASSGLAVGLSPGSATLTASLSGVVGSAPVRVTSATVSGLRFPAAAVMQAVGASRPLQAIGFMSDGSEQDLTAMARFESSDPTSVPVDNARARRGLLSGAGDWFDTATVTATLPGGPSTPGLAVILNSVLAFTDITGTLWTNSLEPGSLGNLSEPGTLGEVHSIHYHPAGHYAYLVRNQSTQVQILAIDPETQDVSVVGDFAIPADVGGPTVWAFSPTGRFLYAGGPGGVAVMGFHPQVGTFVDTGLRIADELDALTVRSDGAALIGYQASSQTVRIYPVDSVTGEVADPLVAAGPTVSGTPVLEADALDRFFWLLDPAGTVYAFEIDPVTGEALPRPGSLALGFGATSLAAAPNGRFMLATGPSGCSHGTAVGLGIDPQVGDLAVVSGPFTGFASTRRTVLDPMGANAWFVGCNKVVGALRLDPATGAVTLADSQPIDSFYELMDADVSR